MTAKPTGTKLEAKGIYNELCPRDPRDLKKRMKESDFAALQQRRSQTEARISSFKYSFLGAPLKQRVHESEPGSGMVGVDPQSVTGDELGRMDSLAQGCIPGQLRLPAPKRQLPATMTAGTQGDRAWTLAKSTTCEPEWRGTSRARTMEVNNSRVKRL
jgi:hypothetical protein